MLSTSVRRPGRHHSRHLSNATSAGCPTGHTTQASQPAGSGGSYRMKGLTTHSGSAANDLRGVT